MELIKAEFVNNMMRQLPVATEFELHIGDGTKLTKSKAIFVDGHEIAVVGKDYKLVQHEQAFRPLIDGLTVAGVKNWEFSAIARNRDVKLNIYVGHANDGIAGIKYGFQVMNSFDGRSAIKVDMKATKAIAEIVQVNKRVVTVWGFRLACQNGMVMKVPLEYHNIVVPEVRVKIESLLRESTRIVHNQKAEDKLKMVGYVVEAFMLLRDPMERMIALGKEITITDFEAAKKLVLQYVGKRHAEAITTQWQLNEEHNLWGLYNAATAFATHYAAERNKTPIMEKAATLFEREIVARQPARA